MNSEKPKLDDDFPGHASNGLAGLLDLAKKYKQDEVFNKLIEKTQATWRYLRKIPKGPNRAREVHGIIDSYIAETVGEKSISCKKACSFCCYQQVIVTEDEADLLLEAKVDIDLKRLERQAKIEEEERIEKPKAWFSLPRNETR